MSNYVSPFLVLNLGSEMVFVIAQRLEAQHVANECAGIVLDEIIAVLFSKPLITELMKPQEAYTYKEVREIIEDVAHSSAMRLDPGSMNKLWELITMVFKWQITMSQQVITVTKRHLAETMAYAKKPSTVEQLQKVVNIVENFEKVLDYNEQFLLREKILLWLSPFTIRVSLLLRMGLQNSDGSFLNVVDDSIAKEMLNNLGENIFAVTKNGKALERCIPGGQQKDENTNELKAFADQIIGEKRKLGTEKTLRLSINVHPETDEDNTKIKKQCNFSILEVKKDENQISDIFKELSVNDDFPNESNTLTDDLLDMIDQNGN